jgi:hypothetical protein
MKKTFLVIGILIGIGLAIHTGKPLAALLSFADEAVVGVVYAVGFFIRKT